MAERSETVENVDGVWRLIVRETRGDYTAIVSAERVPPPVSPAPVTMTEYENLF